MKKLKNLEQVKLAEIAKIAESTKIADFSAKHVALIMKVLLYFEQYL